MTFHTYPLIPAKAGTQSFGRSNLQASPQKPNPGLRASRKNWVPAFAGMSGLGSD
jgi:hypothetical protein